MASPDYVPGAKYGIRAIAGDSLISDLDVASQALVADIEAKLAGYVAGTHAARLAATALEGQLWRETDTGAWFIGTGSAWLQLAGARTTTRPHTWTLDDASSLNAVASKVASFPVYPATGEAVSLIGALVLCDNQGATPSTFKIQTDIASAGTYADVTGLTALTPTTGGYVFVAASSPPSFPNPGPRGVRIVATNAASGTSKGVEVSPVTQHTI